MVKKLVKNLIVKYAPVITADDLLPAPRLLIGDAVEWDGTDWIIYNIADESPYYVTPDEFVGYDDSQWAYIVSDERRCSEWLPLALLEAEALREAA